MRIGYALKLTVPDGDRGGGELQGMNSGVTGIAEAIESPGVDAPEGLVTAQVRRPVRTIAFNVMRFASVIIGAGLLLRAGSSEQAISAINEDKPQPERAAATRLAIPQPAFGHLATQESDGHASVANADATSRGSGIDVPALAFAAHEPQHHAGHDKAQAALNSVLAEGVVQAESSPETVGYASAVNTPAAGLAQAKLAVAPTIAPPKPQLAIARKTLSPAPEARLASMLDAPRTADGLSTPASAVKTATLAVKRSLAVKASAGGPAAAQAALAPSILSPTKRSAAGGLLAPVTLAGRPIGLAINTAAVSARAAGSARTDLSRPAAIIAPTIVSGSSLAAARPQIATRAVVSATSTGSTEPRPSRVLAPASSSAAPGNTGLVNISLAPPIMRPGPRTTVRTSDIQEVMRRPASAWDYAEALPPELTGHSAPGQRSASAPPAQQSTVKQASAQPAMAQSSGARAQAPTASSAQVKPAQNVPLAVQTRQPAQRLAPITQATRPLASRGASGQAALENIQARPVSSEPRAEPSASSPVALINSPVSDHLEAPRRPNPPLPAVRTKLLASAAAEQRSANRHAVVVVHGKVAEAKGKRLADVLVSTPDEEASQPLRISAAANSDPVPRANAPGSGGSALLADASSPDSAGLSLRDRIPRPAF